MTKTLRIAEDLALPLDAATETFAILGKRGSGKSNTAVVLFEEMHRAGIPCVAIDPKGDWYGLRSASDGKGPGLPVPVFGGRHGDVPLEPTAGAYLADLVVDRQLTCVVDVSELSRADVIRFLTAFGVRLYRQAQDEPMHLFLEECHEYLPQRVGPAEAPLVGAWQRIVKQGRFKGLGCTLISQRSAAVNKDVLNQAEALIAMRVLAPHDRAAVKGWVEVHGDSAEVLSTLHELNDGEGWVWAPDMLGAPRRVQFRRRATYDSGATPKVGQRRREPATLADVDLVAIKEAMAESIEKAKAEDPKELRRRVAELERQLRSSKVEAPAPEVVVERVEVPVLSEELVIRLEEALQPVAGVLADIQEHLRWDVTSDGETITYTRRLADDRKDVPRARPAGDDRRPVAAGPPERAPQRPDTPAGRQPRRAPVPGAAADARLGDGAPRRILTALAQHGPLPPGRAAFFAEISARKSTLRNALSTLRGPGWITGSGELAITDAGLEALGDFEELPTGEALLTHWRAAIGEGVPRQVFELLIEAWPDTLTNGEIAMAIGIDPGVSTLRNALSRLRSLGVVEGNAASNDLMEAVRA